jgi:DNA-binding HxlR family transcriptional regulator
MPPPSHFVGTVAVTENLLKRKWSTVILRHLANGTIDPEEIRKLEPGLSLAAMNERLRNMLRFSLIARYPRPATAKVVEYRLTARGEEILKVINLIEQLDQRISQYAGVSEADLGITTSRRTDAQSAKKRLILND